MCACVCLCERGTGPGACGALGPVGHGHGGWDATPPYNLPLVIAASSGMWVVQGVRVNDLLWLLTHFFASLCDSRQFLGILGPGVLSSACAGMAGPVASRPFGHGG